MTQPKHLQSKAHIMSESNKVDIQILGQSYSIHCPSDEVDNLQTAVSHINNQMQSFRKQAPSLEHNKLLVLTALNLCSELFEAQKNAQNTKKSERLLENMLLETKQLLRE